jgi:DNA mismatch repair ATPase MutS
MFKLILKYKNNLLEVFNTVGLIDSLISIASYRESIQYYSVPTLKNTAKLNKPGSGGSSSSKTKLTPWLSFEDIYHPLIKDPVTNSLSINKHILVTGSNASGKSTFLKTIAINAIFAQTIYTCLARKYVSYFFMIFTSMALKDDLLSGESYYIVETKSLKRIIDSINPSIPCLCIIDEVLRGTNTVERIAASSELLKFLSLSNCLAIAATHDLELTLILKNHYKNYHFQEYITGEDIVFDYKLYPGKSETRNAIKLLKIMGYEVSLVDSAEARAKRFIENGKWE